MHDVWKLTALPRSEFDATYLDLWTRTVAYVKAHHPHNAEQFRVELMTLTRAAMRVRQSQIVPRRVPTEEATRLSELITFVLAVAVAMHAIRASVPADAANALEPDWGLNTLLCTASRRWICDEPIANEELQRFSRLDTDSELRDLIELAELRLTTLRAPTKNEAKPKVQAPTVPTRRAKGWRFLEWLRTEIEAGHLIVNAPDSVVHTLPGGETFIVAPAAFDLFQKVDGEPAKRTQNQVARLGVHRVVEGHNLFSANVDGRGVRGLILGRDAGLWTKTPVPNPSLRIRPIR